MKAIFFVLLIWPCVHMIATKTLHFSSWRLFGWGMYATPDMESRSQISIVYVQGKLKSDADVELLYQKTQEILKLPERNSSCATLFFQDEIQKSELIQLSSQDACDDPKVDDGLDYFYQFGSVAYLTQLVHALASRAETGVTEALVFHTIQRLDLAKHRAYTEYRAYRVQAPGVPSASNLTQSFSLATKVKGNPI